MAQSLEALSPDDSAAELVRQQLQAWTPPTPQWADAPARARTAALAAVYPTPARASNFFSRLRRRIDLVGWLLERPNGVPFTMNYDPHDPRLLLYDQISGLSIRYGSPQAIL